MRTGRAEGGSPGTDPRPGRGYGWTTEGGGRGRSLARRLRRYGTTVMRLVGAGPIGGPESVGSR
jgi:hypothetical protein